MPDEVKDARLSAEVEKRIRPFVDEITGKSGLSPRSALLVGPAARGEFSEKNPEIHLILVFDLVSPEILDVLAGLGRRFGAAGIRAPMVLTSEYFTGATDVFPMEFLDLLNNHVRVYGEDLLSGVAVDRAHLRLQCERELRLWRLRLRRAYLQAAGDAGWLSGWMQEAIIDLFPALRAALHLLGGDDQAGNTETASRLKALAPVDFSAAVEIWEDRKAGRKPDKDMAKERFFRWEKALGELVGAVDALEK